MGVAGPSFNPNGFLLFSLLGLMNVWRIVQTMGCVTEAWACVIVIPCGRVHTVSIAGVPMVAQITDNVTTPPPRMGVCVTMDSQVYKTILTLAAL